MYRVLSILSIVLISFLDCRSQSTENGVTCQNVTYSIQVLSTGLCPSIHETKILEIADSFYIEQVTVGERMVSRYLVACTDLFEANQRLVLAKERFKDSFIVIYHEGKRFN